MLVARWEQLAELIVNHENIGEIIKELGQSTIKQWTLGVDLFHQAPVPVEPRA